VANSFMILGFQGFPQNSLNHLATIVLFSCVIRSSLLAAAHSKQAQHTTNHPFSEFVCADRFAGYRVVCRVKNP
jgi:hypothetical protein